MTAVIVLGLVGLMFKLAPTAIERTANRVTTASPYVVSDRAQQVHAKLFVADLHADALLWNRDLTVESSYGHVDVPRLLRGGVALQVFDAVVKTPFNQDYDGNSADSDSITALAFLQRWPRSTWTSLLQRALHQAHKLDDVARRSQGGFIVVRSQSDLNVLVSGRQKRPPLIGGLLGVEGLHCLEGDLQNVEALYAAGFRLMGLSHFFDNELGGSAHGLSKGGLTDFGRQVVQRLEAKSLLVDLAHASPRLVDDVLAMARRPLIVSHTGMKGTCDHIRNLSDEHARRIAATGGVIGIGYWDAAVCDVSVSGIVRAIQYAVRVAGVDHVALGSDFDGATTTPFDTSGVPQITEALLAAGVSEDDVAKIMGGNVLRLLRAALPS